MARQLGVLLTLLRERWGYSQKDVADKLCVLSGQNTVTRHEVSRWEREERTPTDFWLGWLSKVLETPAAELKEARARSKEEDKTVADIDKVPEKVTGTKWRDHARSVRERSLALVSLKFEHRATSVQLSATYEEPAQATAAIGMFRRMVAPEMASATAAEEPAARVQLSRDSRSTTARAGGASDATGPNRAGAAPVPSFTRPAQAAPRPAAVAARPSQPTPAPDGAAPDGGSSPARVPMGIRYTKGPGTDNGNGARPR